MRNLVVLALLCLLFLLMDRQLVGGARHEYLGIVFFFVAILHVGYGRGWMRGWRKGKWGMRRALGTVVNLLLILLAWTAVFTGLLLSTAAFPVANLRGAASIMVHQAHQFSAYAVFLLMGIHVGLHWQGIWARLQAKTGFLRPLFFPGARWVLPIALMAYAAYASFLHRMGDRLMMAHMVFGDSTSPVRYGLDLMLIFAGYAAGAWLAARILHRRQE